MTETRHVKYSVAHLLHAGQQEYRRIVDEYWAFVYSDIFGQLMSDETIQYDKDLLIKLDLPFDADEAAVKKRFRCLAKQVHPDMGGDAHQFIELMDIYRRLITK